MFKQRLRCLQVAALVTCIGTVGSALAQDALEKELTSGPDRDGISFPDFSDTSGLTLNGDAAQSFSALRLAPALENQAGSAFTSSSIDLGPGGTFSTQFSFKITASSAGGGAPGGADGLTFTLQNDPAADEALGGTGGRLGYSGILNSLTVEFDTWFNLFLGDPNSNHVGTATNGVVGNGDAVQLGVPPWLDQGTVFYAWIDYDGDSDVLEVRLDTTNVRPALPTLVQGGIDLEGLLGGTSAYAGFTSATGSAYSDHDILSWQMNGGIDLVVPINVEDPTAYDFTITWNGDTPVWIYDRVPAEWDVTHIEFLDTSDDGTLLPLDCGEATIFSNGFGVVDIFRGGKKGKNCNSDTGFRWMPGEDNTLNVQTLARCHDKGNNFCRPTSCGALYLNYGAIALEKDPETGELVLDENGDPIVVDGPTNDICLAAVDDVNGDGTFTWDGTGDEDGDTLPDYLEACEFGTDPCLADTDGDGVRDDVDDCPLEGPPDPELGEILDPNGCIRQSECSDGIDNDDDVAIDYPADLSCESLVDDSEDTVDCPCFSSTDIQVGGTIAECGENFPGFDDLTGVTYAEGGGACSGFNCSFIAPDDYACSYFPVGVDAVRLTVDPPQDAACRAIIMANCASPNAPSSVVAPPSDTPFDN
jgi:hypothetical protein